MGRVKDKLYTGTLLKSLSRKKHPIRNSLDRHMGDVARTVISNGMEVVPNRVAFITFQGTYTCNPKAICEALVKTGAPVEIYWVVNKGTFENRPDDIPEQVKLVQKNTAEGFRIIATSKVWVDNAGTFMWTTMPKKKEQVYFMTWHGSMGLKRIDNNDDKHWRSKIKNCADAANYVISNSTFENEVFRTSFWENTPILEYGHARNDILFDKSAAAGLKKKINEMYQILPYDRWSGSFIGDLDDVRICLFAPTFKSDKTIVDEVDFDAILKALEKKYGHKWIILDRRHFHNRRTARSKKKHDRVIDVTSYVDMQDLIAIADVGITDYSSWICDFVLTGKPGFIYAEDLDEYTENDRGFYYPLTELPYPIAKTMDELTANIENHDDEALDAKCQKFLEARGCWEDGHASEKIAAKILEELGLDA